MQLRAIIAATPAPATVSSLADDLRRLGVKPGAVMLVHTSLSAMGWVCGGAAAVIEALLQAVGPAGTLVMPTQSADLSDPARWTSPAVPAAWLDIIREHMPAYDPAITPTRGMGAVAELFRTWPGAVRSRHPSASFTALGPHAARIIAGHALEDPFGEASPLARLYDLSAAVLLLGVGYETCTALHLAERRARPVCEREAAGAPMLVNGVRHWVTFTVPPASTTQFAALGEQLVDQGAATIGGVGCCQAHYLPMRLIIDFAEAKIRAADQRPRQAR